MARTVLKFFRKRKPLEPGSYKATYRGVTINREGNVEIVLDNVKKIKVH